MVMRILLITLSAILFLGQQLSGQSRIVTETKLKPETNSDKVKTALADAKIDPGQYEFSGQINAAVYLDGINFSSEDFCLYSVVGNQVRGISRGMWFEPGKVWVHSHMTYSNLAAGDTVRFRLYDKHSNAWHSFDEYVVFSSDMIIANALIPFKLQNSVLMQSTLLSLEPFMTIWPNPASSIINIKYAITTDQQVVIQIIDGTCRLVEELDLGNQQSGEHVSTLDMDHLKQGIYFLRMKVDGSVNQRLIISR